MNNRYMNIRYMNVRYILSILSILGWYLPLQAAWSSTKVASWWPDEESLLHDRLIVIEEISLMHKINSVLYK